MRLNTSKEEEKMAWICNKSKKKSGWFFLGGERFYLEKKLLNMWLWLPQKKISQAPSEVLRSPSHNCWEKFLSLNPKEKGWMSSSTWRREGFLVYRTTSKNPNSFDDRRRSRLKYARFTCATVKYLVQKSQIQSSYRLLARLLSVKRKKKP